MSYRHIKGTFTEKIAEVLASTPNTDFIPLFTGIIINSGIKLYVRFGGLNAKVREYKYANNKMKTATITYNITPTGNPNTDSDDDWGVGPFWTISQSTRARCWTADLGSVYTNLTVYLKYYKGANMSFWICVSSDGTNYTDVFSRPTTSQSEERHVILTLTNVRYIAIDIQSTASDTFVIREIRAYTSLEKEVSAQAGLPTEFINATFDEKIDVYICGNNPVSYYAYTSDLIKVSDVEGKVT